MSVAKKTSTVLNNVLTNLEMSAAEMAVETGVSYNSIQKLLGGDVDTIRGMRLETVETALNALGYKLIVKEKK